MSYGERIKELRSEHKLTQKELAEKMGILPQSLIKYEKNKSSFTLKFKEKLLKAFTKDEVEYIEHGDKKSFSQSIIGDGNNQAGRDNHLLKELDNIEATINDPLIAALVEIMKKTDDDMKKLQVIQYATEVVLGKKE